MKLWFVLRILTLFIPTAISQPSGCIQSLDVVFILDSSGSICNNNAVPQGASCDNWELAIEFVQDLVKAIGSSPTTTRFGLVMFSNLAHNKFYLNSYNTTQQIVDAVEELKYEYMDSVTDTQQGIISMHKQQFVPERGDRPNVNNLAIIITDGKSTVYPENTIPAAEAARRDDIEIISIGVTGGINENELKGISSMPQTLNQNYFTVADYRTLAGILEQVKSELCRTTTTTTTTTTKAPSNCHNLFSGASITVEQFSSAQEAGFEFHCNFDYEVTLPFEVRAIWYIDNKQFKTDSIYSGSRSRAVLRDVDWVKRGVKLGFWVHCSVQVVAYDCAGEIRDSERFFAGIKVHSNPQVENVNDVTEIIVKEGATAYIYLRPTVPLVCTPNAIPFCKFEIEVHVPKEADPNPPRCAENLAEIQKLAFNQEGQTRCRYEVNMTNQNDWIKIPVAAVRDNLFDQSRGSMVRHVKLKTPSIIFVHKTWQDYDIGDVQVRIEDTDVKRAGVNCFSRSDPWLSSFDTDGQSESFSFHEVGEFVFYEHDTLPIKIHIYTTRCSTLGKGTCTCAVAIQAGLDVVIIDKCDDNKSSNDKKGKSRFATHGCEELGRGLRIIENTIDDYEVHLPTGATVHVTKDEYKPLNWVWLQVVLKPSDQDFNATSGLCGRWNNDKSDDQMPKLENGQTFLNSWRVPSSESLYNGKATIPDGKRDLYGHVYCDCADDNEAVECDANTYNLCEGNKDISLYHREKCRLRKRSTTLTDEEDEIEYIFNPLDNDSEPPTWPTPSGIIESRAREACEERMVRSSQGSVCGAVDNYSSYQKQSVEECMGDIKFSDSYFFVNGTFSSFVDICRTEIVVNYDNWNIKGDPSGEVTIEPPVVLTTFCPGNCQGNGDCIAGKCQCRDRYFDKDCSRKITDPPETDSLVRDGLCDTRLRPCQSVTVRGAYFFKSNTLTCHMTPVKVTEQSTSLRSPILVEATYDYSEEVKCPIPSWPEDVDVGDGNQGYMVSVSNDGGNTGSEFLFLKYDPACETCSTATKNCVKKTDVCRIDGFCYNDQEIPEWNECYICDIAVSKVNLQFIDSQECRRKCLNGGKYTIVNICICPAGYTGTDCSQEINACDSSPCKNGATCVREANRYQCRCIEGFIGEHCDRVKPPCSISLCRNGICIADDCICFLGFTGEWCENPIRDDECNTKPCQNGGTCMEEVFSYSCTCPSGFSGPNCEINLNPCNSDPCQNGGLCSQAFSEYACTCPPGYTGTSCETFIDVCESTPCLNGGTCRSGVNGYTCQCPSTHTSNNCAWPIVNRPRTTRPAIRPTTTRPTRQPSITSTSSQRRATTRPNRG